MRPILCLACGAVAAIAAPARAAPDAPALTFDEALGLADRTPSVEGARAGAAAHREVATRISSQTSNPQLWVEPGYRVSSSEASTTRVEGSAWLIQSWNLAGLSSRRREAATAATGQLEAEARATALARRLSAAQVWIDLWAAQAALGDATQEAALAADLAARTERGAAAALLTRADAADAAAYRAEARLLALSVEGEVTDLGYRLGREVARPPAALTAAGALPSAPVPPAASWPALVGRAAALPTVAAQRLAAHAAAARDAEARAARGLDLTLGAGLQRDNLGEHVASAHVGVTLPLFDRGEAEAAPYVAAAARGRLEAEEAGRAAASELARSLHEVEHTKEVLDELEANALPAAVEAARLREVAFQAGDATVLEVLVARRGAAAARARLSRARAAHAWAAVKAWLQLSEVERAPGGSP